MFIRYWHTFVRFSGLFIIPLIILPILATLLLFSTNSYVSGASFWVQESPYLSVSQVTDGNNFDSPSTVVGGLLSELLSTREFMNNVIDNTPLKDKAKTEADRETITAAINKNLKMDTTGYRLVQLSYTDKDPTTALAVLTTIVNNFKTYYDNREAQQTQSAVAFYTDLLQKDQTGVDAAKKAVDDFLQNHQDVLTDLENNKATSPNDLEYQGLSSAYDKARQQYTTDQESLQKVQTDYQAFLKGGGTTLVIQDTPKVFDANSSKSKAIEMGVLVGAGATIALALIFTIIATLLDKSMRESGYAQRVLRLDRVLELPAIQPAKSWYNDLETQNEAKLVSQKLLPSPDSTKAKKKKTKAGARLRQILAWQIRTY